MTTVGFELEVMRGAAGVLDHLNRTGMTNHSRLCYYHCGCPQCDPVTFARSTDTGPYFKAQEDCTVSGEFITHIFDLSSTAGYRHLDRAITGISHALLKSGAELVEDCGNHVHVGHADIDDAAKMRLWRLFARYQHDLTEIAAGPRYLREYNCPMAVRRDDLWEREVPGVIRTRNVWGDGYDEHYARMYDFINGSFLAWKPATVEFRLWNAVKAPWRIRTHVGLSVAMVEAAIAGADCTRDDPRCVEDVIGDHIDAPTWAGILKQRFSKGGLMKEVVA